jgi:hypothetical protein
MESKRPKVVTRNGEWSYSPVDDTLPLERLVPSPCACAKNSASRGRVLCWVGVAGIVPRYASPQNWRVHISR